MSRQSPLARVAPAEKPSGDLDVHALLARGDRKGAIAALMDAYGQAVFGFCVRYLHNHSLAEDVLQRVFIDAYRDIDGFQGRSSFCQWLLGIANHRCQDARKSQMRREQRISSDEQAMVSFADPGSTPTERLESTRLAAALADCLANLSEEVRTTVLLRFQQGMSYEEMSDLLGANAGTLHARVSRALPALKRCLESKGWKDE